MKNIVFSFLLLGVLFFSTSSMAVIGGDGLGDGDMGAVVPMGPIDPERITEYLTDRFIEEQETVWKEEDSLLTRSHGIIHDEYGYERDTFRSINAKKEEKLRELLSIHGEEKEYAWLKNTDKDTDFWWFLPKEEEEFMRAVHHDHLFTRLVGYGSSRYPIEGNDSTRVKQEWASVYRLPNMRENSRNEMQFVFVLRLFYTKLLHFLLSVEERQLQERGQGFLNSSKNEAHYNIELYHDITLDMTSYAVDSKYYEADMDRSSYNYLLFNSSLTNGKRPTELERDFSLLYKYARSMSSDDAYRHGIYSNTVDIYSYGTIIADNNHWRPKKSYCYRILEKYLGTLYKLDAMTEKHKEARKELLSQGCREEMEALGLGPAFSHPYPITMRGKLQEIEEIKNGNIR